MLKPRQKRQSPNGLTRTFTSKHPKAMVSLSYALWQYHSVKGKAEAKTLSKTHNTKPNPTIFNPSEHTSGPLREIRRKGLSCKTF